MFTPMIFTITGFIVFVASLVAFSYSNVGAASKEPELPYFNAPQPSRKSISHTSDTHFDFHTASKHSKASGAVCLRCGGSGHWRDIPWRTCFRCNGSGVDPSSKGKTC